ncbi:hypothetical protein WISP_109926 [Willisornis vidua]|uniref:Reverse transcriptase domain-containing protein n=1 Tax=Willisornis vidua TaxID=1566151 RepID=A0ABQ9D194_9PASS|nr:hypothetical protein WISP_109926 [Willisornis vidua]
MVQGIIFKCGKLQRKFEQVFQAKYEQMTSATIITFFDETATWMDQKRAMDIVYLDFSKAFDTVSHNILINKLRKCGLDEDSEVD